MPHDLLPVAAYLPATSIRRTAVTMALLWGVPMGYMVVSSSALPLPVALGVTAAAALLFGVLWTVMFGRTMRRLMQSLHAADSSLVPPPPGEYTVRVMASLLTSRAFAVGGHLYAGATGLAFVPHLKNRRTERAPRTLRWAEIVRIEPFVRPAPRLARFVSAEPLTHVRVVTQDGDWLLRVPACERVAAELQAVQPGAPAMG